MHPYVGMFGIMLLLPGCLGSGAFGCNAHYEEAYGGYDYNYGTIDVSSDGSLTVILHLLNGGGDWFENSDEFQEEGVLSVVLTIEFSDGSTKKINHATANWSVVGDASNGSYWGTDLTITGPAGACDDGCERLSFSATDMHGAIYYDHTCDASPWVDV